MVLPLCIRKLFEGRCITDYLLVCYSQLTVLKIRFLEKKKQFFHGTVGHMSLVVVQLVHGSRVIFSERNDCFSLACIAYFFPV